MARLFHGTPRTAAPPVLRAAGNLAGQTGRVATIPAGRPGMAAGDDRPPPRAGPGRAPKPRSRCTAGNRPTAPAKALDPANRTGERGPGAAAPA